MRYINKCINVISFVYLYKQKFAMLWCIGDISDPIKYMYSEESSKSYLNYGNLSVLDL